MDIKQQLDQIKTKINQFIENIKAWPQYRQIGAVIIALGFILLIIGILIY